MPITRDDRTNAFLSLRCKHSLHEYTCLITYYTLRSVGRHSSDCTGTRYGLDGPEIEFRWGQNFSHVCRRALWTTQPPTQWVPGIFVGGKAAGAWRWPTIPSSAEVKHSVELYLYSPPPDCLHSRLWGKFYCTFNLRKGGLTPYILNSSVTWNK
jgi:hypothetical protein